MADTFLKNKTNTSIVNRKTSRYDLNNRWNRVKKATVHKKEQVETADMGAMLFIGKRIQGYKPSDSGYIVQKSEWDKNNLKTFYMIARLGCHMQAVHMQALNWQRHWLLPDTTKELSKETEQCIRED